MSNVVFVTPNMGNSVNDIPVGTLLLSDILRNNGIESEILQFYQFGNDFKDFGAFIDTAIKMIMEKSPKIVSFYTRCDTYHITLRIAERIKSIDKSIYTVFGGPQADLTAVPTVKNLSFVDYVCCGEGESTITPFFSSLLSGNPDLSVAGLVYRKGEETVVNPRPEFISDFESLPLVNESMVENCTTEDGIRKFPIETGRGCPFGCTYCSTKTFWNRKYRLKTSERIIAELKAAHEKYGITDFNFKHDMFTMNREKIINICKELKNIGFPVTWRCSARIDCLDEELIDIMADSGFVGVFIGIETGSPRMQKLINKNLKLDNTYSLISYITAKGIHVTASFMYGFPEETDEDFSCTIDLMCKLATIKNIKLIAGLCTFLPGTEMTSRYKDEFKRTNNFSLVTGDFATKECADLIYSNPEIFPQYFEYKTELREKSKYYHAFVLCMKAAYPVYKYIADLYDKSRLCDMVYEFSRINGDAIENGASVLDILKNNEFVDLYANDEKYGILKEVLRYIVWKTENTYNRNSVSEIFAFDVALFEKNKKVEELSEELNVVSLTFNEKGNRMEIKKML